MAQITIDGVRTQSELDSRYGAPKFVQSLPTSLGDNRADLCASVGNRVAWALNNSNSGGVGGSSTIFDSVSDPTQYQAALDVTTGLELRIPLSQLGNPTGNVRIAGYVGNNGGNYCSNHFIGGFAFPAGASRGNLGGTGTGGFNGSLNGVDLSNETNPGPMPGDPPVIGNAPGNQFVTFTASNATVTAPTLDGTIDPAFYGPALFVQNVGAGFGNGNGDPYNSGSEINAVYGKIGTADLGDGSGPQQYLFVFISGNIKGQFADNFSGDRLQFFFDSGDPAGLNQLPSGLPIPGLGGSGGLKFDTAFKATHSLSVNGGYLGSANGYRVQAIFAKLTGTPSGGVVGISEANTAGLGAGSACPPDNYISLGSEIDAVYSYMDLANKKLNVLVTGNVKAGDFLHMFFDAAAGGQNVIRADNTTGGLPNFWSYLGGTKFDTGYAPDYALTFHFESGNKQVFDADLLRTNGPAFFTTTPSPLAILDFHSFFGADVGTQALFNSTTYNANQGNGARYQDGSKNGTPSSGDDSLFTSYSPREANRLLQAYITSTIDPMLSPNGLFPVNQLEWDTFVTTGLPPAVPPIRSGEIIGATLNRNVAGVRAVGDSVGDATTATHGVEFSISLRELGWNAGSRIRMAGFISSSNQTVIGNQVFGGLPAGSNANILLTPAIDFGTIAGNQFVQVANCYADFSQDGNLNIDDIFIFLNAWFAGSAAADVNDNGLTIDDIFIFLNFWFAGCTN